jgi:hypothetical protein
MEMFDVPADMSRTILRGQRQHLVDRGASIRHLLQSMIDQAIQAARLVARQIAAKAALAHP